MRTLFGSGRAAAGPGVLRGHDRKRRQCAEGHAAEHADDAASFHDCLQADLKVRLYVVKAQVYNRAAGLARYLDGNFGRTACTRRGMRRAPVVAGVAIIAIAGAVWFQKRAVRPSEPPPPPPVATPSGPARPAATRVVSRDARLDAIVRAQVWREPAPGGGRSRLPAHDVIEELSCRFVLKRLNGTTPKFNCLLDTGEEVRIKYGKGAEIPAEAAATRLLRALGFGADEITLVRHLRCYGCPLEPFTTSKALQTVRAGRVYEHVLDYDDFHDFEWVALERKYDAWPIEADMQEGWAFTELDRIDASKGGAPRAHVDALRLAAVFLEALGQQGRQPAPGLRCPRLARRPAVSGAVHDAAGSRCHLRPAQGQPAAMADGHHLGRPRRRCRITMRHLPYSGATFVDSRVGEAGRQLLPHGCSGP